jgi:hypothetical protein
MSALLSLLGVTAGTFFQLAAPQMRASHELRIGSDSEPEYEFTVIRDAVLDDAGNLFVLLPREQQIRVYSPNGRFLRSIGRKGQGPGEFMWPLGLGWKGDTLWVRDVELGRVYLFGVDGRLHRTITKRMPLVGGRYMSGPPVSVLADGRLLGVGDAPSIMIADGHVKKVPMLIFSEQDESFRMIRELWQEHLYGNQPPGRTRPGVHFAQRLADAPLWTVAVDGSRIVVIDRSASEGPARTTFEVTVFDTSGAAVKRSIPYLPRPVSKSFRDSVVQQSLNPKHLPGEYDEEVVYTPAFRPPVTDAVLTRDGRLWLKREFSFEKQTDWDVLDSSLRIVGRVRLPSDFQLMDGSGDIIWGVRTGSDDVPYLSRYRLGGRPSQSSSRQTSGR